MERRFAYAWELIAAHFCLQRKTYWSKAKNVFQQLARKSVTRTTLRSISFDYVREARQVVTQSDEDDDSDVPADPLLSFRLEKKRIQQRLKLVTLDAVRDGSEGFDTDDFFIDPRSAFRVRWDFCLGLLAILTAINIPYVSSFKTLPNFSEGHQVLFYFVDFLFIIDIVLNFYTAFFDSYGRLVAAPESIKTAYFKLWFWMDVFANFPLELVISIFVTRLSRKQTSAFQYNRMLRLTRIFRAGSGIVKVLEVVVPGLVVMHSAACIWHSVKRYEDGDETEDLGEVGVNHQDDTFEVYIASLYGTLLGFMGDAMNSKSTVQIVLALGITVVGNGIVAIMFGTIAHQLNSLNWKRAQFQQARIALRHVWRLMMIATGLVKDRFVRQWYEYKSDLQSRNDVMTYLNMPASMQHQVNQFYEYKWLRYRDMKGGLDDFLEPLPEPLQLDIKYFYHSSLLDQVESPRFRLVPLFKKLSVEAMELIVRGMTTRMAIPAEIILRRQSPSNGFYLISRGTCEEINTNSQCAPR
eukprot:gene7309-8702_t